MDFQWFGWDGGWDIDEFADSFLGRFYDQKWMADVSAPLTYTISADGTAPKRDFIPPKRDFVPALRTPPRRPLDDFHDRLNGGDVEVQVIVTDELGNCGSVKMGASMDDFDPQRNVEVLKLKPESEELVPWSYIERYVPNIRQMVENKKRLVIEEALKPIDVDKIGDVLGEEEA